MIGVSNFTSHFSIGVQLEDQGKNHPIVLSEGQPYQANIDFGKFKYFMFTVEDVNITEVSIQLETLHGDVDLLVSFTNKTPDMFNSEAFSNMPGLYQDVLTFRKSEKFNLTRNFYIGVWGDEASTFSIKYFTKAADGSIGI